MCFVHATTYLTYRSRIVTGKLVTLETHVAVNAQCVLLLINFVSFPGSVGPGSAAVAVAAHQAVTTTLGMQSGRRGSGALKPPYAEALGELIWN